MRQLVLDVRDLIWLMVGGRKARPFYHLNYSIGDAFHTI